VNRVMVYLACLAGIGGAVYLAGPTMAQTPPPGGTPTPAAKPTSGRVAVFNVARVMKEYQKWQYYAATMSNKRITEATGLAKMQSDIVNLQEQAKKEPIVSKQEELMRQAVAKKRELEDKERQARKVLDEESQTHLKNLFAEIQMAVKAIVDTNGYDLVMAYPDAITDEERNSPMYFDLKMRPPAAMPFYVSPSVDISNVLVATLNSNFKAPGPIPAMIQPPVQQSGVQGGQPGQPGQP
jgi:Skp family chaperone for outer membrane proteins